MRVDGHAVSKGKVAMPHGHAFELLVAEAYKNTGGRGKQRIDDGGFTACQSPEL